MINLHKDIKEKYEIEALQQLQLWEKNVLRASDYRNHRIFTLKCISHNLTLVSVKLKPSDSKISPSARKIIEKAERQLMQDRVRDINRVIKESDNNRNNNKTRLPSIVTSTDLDRCGNFIDKAREERYNRIKARHIRKFHILFSKSKHYKARDNNNNSNPHRSSQGVNANSQGRSNNNRLDNNIQSEDNNNNKWVINLSSKSLTESQKSVLAKRPNFSTAPKYITNVECITMVESMCPLFREEEAMELRSDVNALLRKSNAPKPNITRQENIGLAELKKDKDRVILTADKGVAIVIMDKEDYINKPQELLAQPAYRGIPRDPTSIIKA